MSRMYPIEIGVYKGSGSTTYQVVAALATTTNAGLMSTEDKLKLNSISTVTNAQIDALFASTL